MALSADSSSSERAISMTFQFSNSTFGVCGFFNVHNLLPSLFVCVRERWDKGSRKWDALPITCVRPRICDESMERFVGKMPLRSYYILGVFETKRMVGKKSMKALYKARNEKPKNSVNYCRDFLQKLQTFASLTKKS